MADRLGEVHVTIPPERTGDVIDATNTLIGSGDTIELRGTGRERRLVIRSARAEQLAAALAKQGLDAGVEMVAGMPADTAAVGAYHALLSAFEGQGAILVGVEEGVPVTALPDDPAAFALFSMLRGDTAQDNDAVPAKKGCPDVEYVGREEAYGLEIVAFPSAGNVPKREADAQRAALADATAQAIADASRASIGIEPNCAPCTRVLQISITPGEAKRLLDATTLPDDAPQKLKDTLAKLKLDTVYAIYTAQVTWVAYWLCREGDGRPAKPASNPGAGTVLSGGKEIKVPCPRPFLSGKATIGDVRVAQSELTPPSKAAIDRAKEETAKKRTTELQTELTKQIRSAMERLKRCPTDCPQLGPVAVQVGPSDGAINTQENTTMGTIHEFKNWYCFWSVERNCKAPG